MENGTEGQRFEDIIEFYWRAAVYHEAMCLELGYFSFFKSSL